MHFDLDAALPDLFRAIDLIGVLLNGIIGGRLARTKRFDAVGFSVLAIMSALAGGMLRDVLLQVGPPVALTDPFYLGTALLGAAIAMLWKLESRPWRIALVVADGTVLGCWAATGALKTLNAGFGVLPAIMLGIITAVGGGAIRDISAGNVPQVFGGNNLYATPALASAAIMVVFWQAHSPNIGMLVATVVGSGFTVVSHWRKWQLPQAGDWTLTVSSAQLKRLFGEWASGATKAEAIRNAGIRPSQFHGRDGCREEGREGDLGGGADSDGEARAPGTRDDGSSPDSGSA